MKPLDPGAKYLPIRDHGLIGDCHTAALVARDGAVVFLCAPRFDSPPVFCSLLDADIGGRFLVAPEGAQASCQRYLDETPILQTDIRARSGSVRITDACTVRQGARLSDEAIHARGELLRLVEVLDGRVRVRVELEPRGRGSPRRVGEGLRWERDAGLPLELSASRRLQGERSVIELSAGERMWVALRWGDAVTSLGECSEAVMDHTAQAWAGWLEKLEYEGPQAELVRRSAVTLKVLDYSANGAIVAAPTSSLPEVIGGVRNWDYRYTWIRDAAFSVYALRRIGLHREGDAFLTWVLGLMEEGKPPRVLYDLDGHPPPMERDDPELAGYRGSRPVRWGNAAVEQHQNDMHGEIIDCAFQWSHRHGAPGGKLWEKLRYSIERAREVWDDPDHSIWEVRSGRRPFTYSAALCQVAIDRGWRIAERYSLPGDHDAWREEAGRIRDAILERAWNPHKQALAAHLGGSELGASVLALPLRRVVAADDPRMVATTRAVERELGAGDGLLYRYLPEGLGDGLPGHEGAFVLCSFWLVDNYARQGRVDEAMALYDKVCARAGPLGLLPEEIDPATGDFLGNYPQAFSHVGVIASGINLARAQRRR